MIFWPLSSLDFLIKLIKKKTILIKAEIIYVVINITPQILSTEPNFY